jgi:polyhydroxyalkanoate synthesis repressor PhaR
VTLGNLSQVVKDRIDFVVYDVKSNAVIPRQILTHIFLEEECKNAQNPLPVDFPQHLIFFYGNSLQLIVLNYLEHSMQYFTQNKDRMREYMCKSIDRLSPFVKPEGVGTKIWRFLKMSRKCHENVYSH